jgi:hypothetical protein
MPKAIGTVRDGGLGLRNCHKFFQPPNYNGLAQFRSKQSKLEMSYHYGHKLPQWVGSMSLATQLIILVSLTRN